MRRETQNVLLVLLGGALGKIALDGSYLRYVKPWARPGLLAAGGVVLLLGVVAIVVDLRRGTVGSDPGAPHGPGHGHRPPRSPWLLLLPVLAILLVAPPALGSDAVTRAGGRSAVAGRAPAAFPPLPTGEAPTVGLSDFVSRAVWDTTGSLERRPVRLTGFVVRQGSEVDLARLVISCCAADAQPVRVRLAGSGLTAAAPDSWLDVRGVLVPGSATAADGYVPTVTVLDAQPVAAPSDPYEY